MLNKENTSKSIKNQLPESHGARETLLRSVSRGADRCSLGLNYTEGLASADSTAVLLCSQPIGLLGLPQLPPEPLGQPRSDSFQNASEFRKAGDCLKDSA